MKVDKIEDMTLKNFAVTDENRSAYHICKRILEVPDCFRLVFINLPADQRLHLKHAILNYYQDAISLKCASAQGFCEDLIEAIAAGGHPHYNFDRYIKPEILLVDDVQLLDGKPYTQEEFYLLLKERLERKKMTVLFSECGIAHLQEMFRDDLANLLNLAAPEEET